MAEDATATRGGLQGRLYRLRGYTGGEMLAEFLGTFFLCLLGCGSVAVAIVGLSMSGRDPTEFGPANWIIIAWGWGFAVVFGVYIAGGVSGAHINPAVTLGLAVRRGFPWRKVIPYWFAQVTGGFLAAALVYATYVSAIDAYNQEQGLTRPESLNTYAIFATFPAEYFGDSWWGPFLDQIVGTAILVCLIFAIIDSRNVAPWGAPTANVGPFVIGMVVTVIGFTFGPNAGYAINPARDFGPRLWAWVAGWGELALPGTFEWFSNYFWIPILGPLVGGVVGAVVYDLFVGQVLAARAGVPVPPGRTPEDRTES